MKKLLLTRSLLVLGTVAILTVVHAPVPAFAQAVEVTADPEAAVITATTPAPSAYILHGGEAFGGGDSFSLGEMEGFGGSDDIESLEKQIAEMNAAIDSINKSGSKEDNEKGQLRNLQTHKEELSKQLNHLKRLAPLQKMVDVSFTNATVAQAAEALSKASGLTIRVEDSIPDSTRLTVEAHHVRLSNVLESVARQAGLVIEPIDLEDSGKPLAVVLTMPPMLRVNDVTQKFPTPLSPWSDKWGTPPTRRYFLSGGLNENATYAVNNRMRDAQRYASAARQYARDAQQYARAANQRAFTSIVNGEGRLALNQSVTIVPGDAGTTVMTSKDGTVTVRESGKNKRDKGTWTTIYTMKNGELVKQSRTFKKD